MSVCIKDNIQNMNLVIGCTVGCSYSTTSGNWSGDNGAIKVHSKTTSGCYIVVGGNFSTSRNVDWFAFGV